MKTILCMCMSIMTGFAAWSQDTLCLQRQRGKQVKEFRCLDVLILKLKDGRHITVRGDYRLTDSSIVYFDRSQADSAGRTLFSDIVWIKTFRFHNRAWGLPFGYLFLGGGLATAMVPLVALGDGTDSGMDVLKSAAILETISLPFWIAISKRKFGIAEHAWAIKTNHSF